MTYATFRAAAEHIARAGTITPHQLAAWEAAWRSASDAQRREFTELWRAQGSPAAPPPAAADPAWLAPALRIIKEFEGCHLESYLCPAGVPTIGWGSTRLIDRPVQLGDRISQEMADDLLRNDVERRHRELVKLLPLIAGWPGPKVAALVSWAYNVGLSAVAGSTLRRRLLAGEDPVQVVSQELPRWDKANGKPLAGLTRRRAAEVALFVGQQLQQQAPQTPVLVTPRSPFSAFLTPYIRIGEFALDQEARRFHHQHQVDTAAELAAFLERVRKQFGGRPIIITSGYRPPAINRSVGGASGSEHLFDAPNVGAVDFYVKGADIRAVEKWIDGVWPYSLGYGAVKGFHHVGIRRGRPRVRWDY
jgi:GH24 family phage-related lysozyme (muramidase)